MKDRGFPNEIEQVLRKIPQKQADYFRDYFRNAPSNVLQALSLEMRKADRVLVEENEPIEKVYVLLDGKVKAMDYRVKGTVYEFACFDAVMVFGAMECLFDVDHYMATLISKTPCVLVSAPRSVFEKWILSDLHALRMENVNMRRYLLDYSRESRMMMLLDGTERLIYLLSKQCGAQGYKDEYMLAINRQVLAEQSGTSVKTINRSMKKLEETGFLLRVGHKVKIAQNQYALMRESLGLILGSDGNKDMWACSNTGK